MKEPMRMRETNELPSALRDAFGALGRDAPSAEVALRVQRALQALPAAAPGATAVGTLSLGKLLVLATLISGAVTSAVVLNSRREAPHAEHASRTIRASARQELAPAQPSQPTQGDPPFSASNESHEPAAPADPAMRSGRTPEKGETLAAPRRARPRPLVVASKPRANLSAHWVQGLLAPSVEARGSAREQSVNARGSASPTQPARADEHRAQSRQDAAPHAQQTTSDDATVATSRAAQGFSPPPSAAGAQASEAQRLAQCKRLASRDPEQALRQLEALALQIPNGVFVQERELLAIRLHERLGHSATASELARRFLERYPNSVYRRALSP